MLSNLVSASQNVADKTFGLKNKNKSKNVQQCVHLTQFCPNLLHAKYSHCISCRLNCGLISRQTVLVMVDSSQYASSEADQSLNLRRVVHLVSVPISQPLYARYVNQMEQSAKAAAVRRGVESSAASKDQKKVCGWSGLLQRVPFYAYVVALHCIALIKLINVKFWARRQRKKQRRRPLVNWRTCLLWQSNSQRPPLASLLTLLLRFLWDAVCFLITVPSRKRAFMFRRAGPSRNRAVQQQVVTLLTSLPGLQRSDRRGTSWITSC